MALGAERTDVVRMVLRTTLHVIGIGIGVRLPASVGVAHVLSTQLFGVTPYDPAMVTVVIAVVIFVGVVATYIPAWQATRVDPMVALRHE